MGCGAAGERGVAWIPLPQCPWWRLVSSDMQQIEVSERVDGDCCFCDTVHTGYHDWDIKCTQTFYLKYMHININDINVSMLK